VTLQQVAFDIETTGFDADDEVTVVGFALPMGCRVFLQTGGEPCPGVASVVEETAAVPVKVTVHETEAALLERVERFGADRLRGADKLLVAFNGETFRGGFDLPFLRTRFARQDVDWPFVDVPYADLYPVVRDLFNTTVDGEDASSLTAAHETLGCAGLDDEDPFVDSAEAVAAFEEGRFAAVAAHNIADVLRTEQLGRVAERYCSNADFNVKSLTPTRDS
jgi:uncharacterized protein YprB with RNaseH-like and TPR domain